MHGSLDMGYIHRETTSPSFYHVQQNEDKQLATHMLQPPLQSLKSLSQTPHNLNIIPSLKDGYILGEKDTNTISTIRYGDILMNDPYLL